MEFSHYSVMLPQCMEGLHIKPDGTYIDGTAGGAGHSKAIAERLTTGRLLSFDRDPDAVAEAAKRLAPYPTAEVVHSEFARIPEVLAEKGIPGADGILLDLGVSSYQLDNPERGFAYSVDAPLDMRMSREGMTAAELLNSYDKLSRQRVKGENIQKTMFEMEGMMETIAGAFEKQLDSLFDDDALDIAADISVMESILKQEGLSGEDMKMPGLDPNDTSKTQTK